MQRAKLKNFSICKSSIGTFYLKGSVYQHPLFQDGELVNTSSVRIIDFGTKIAVTKNTIYELEF